METFIGPPAHGSALALVALPAGALAGWVRNLSIYEAAISRREIAKASGKEELAPLPIRASATATSPLDQVAKGLFPFKAAAERRTARLIRKGSN